ncbi:hypothetical protein [Desulfoplanes sp.]
MAFPGKAARLLGLPDNAEGYIVMVESDGTILPVSCRFVHALPSGRAAFPEGTKQDRAIVSE